MNKSSVLIKNKIKFYFLGGLGIILIIIIGIVIAFNGVYKNNKMCEIKFDTAGGNHIESATFKCGKEIINKPNNPTKAGFRFVNWQLNGMDYKFDKPILDNSILVAKWEVDGDKETIMVTFNTLGANEIASREIIKGEKVVKPENPKKDGYKFEYWTLDNVEFDFDTKVNEDIELKAKWKKLDENGNVTSISCAGSVGKSQTISMNKNTSNPINVLFNIGLSYNKNCKVTYKSSDSSIASVNSNGKVQTSSNEGSASIYACLTDKKTGADYDCFKGIINVKKETSSSNIDDIPTHIHCNGVAYVNENSILNISTYSGNFAKYYDSIESSNPDIIQVVDSKNLILKGLKPGKSIITLKMKNGYNTTCTVNSLKNTNPVQLVNITNCPKTIYKGDTIKLFAEHFPQNADITKKLWKIKNGSNEIKLNQDGTIKALNTGNVLIDYFVYTDNEYVHDSCEFNILSKPITELKLNKSNYELIVGDVEKITTTYSPSTVDEPLITFSTSDTSIAKFDKYNNIIGVKPGVAIITAKSNSDESISATAFVRVDYPTVEFNKESLHLYKKDVAYYGEDYHISVYPSKLNDGLKYYSSNSNVATVNSYGTITAVEKGEATITLESRDGKYSDNLKVFVENPPIKGVFKIVDNNDSLGTLRAQFAVTGGTEWYSYFEINLYKEDGTFIRRSIYSTIDFKGDPDAGYYLVYNIRDSDGVIYKGTTDIVKMVK